MLSKLELLELNIYDKQKANHPTLNPHAPYTASRSCGLAVTDSGVASVFWWHVDGKKNLFINHISENSETQFPSFTIEFFSDRVENGTQEDTIRSLDSSIFIHDPK